MKNENDVKILAGVVLFNPDSSVFENIKKIVNIPEIDLIFIYDNSNYSNESKIVEDKKIVYYSEYDNKGIAYALKKIMSYAIANKFTYVLTLDQDSVVSNLNGIKELLSCNSDYAILTLNYNKKYNSSKPVKNVKYVISSGNFINVEKYKQIKGFNEDLFIDYVDFDLCYQFHEIKSKIGVCVKYFMQHTIGTPMVKKIAFLKIKSFNHSPIRYYYRYRNELYCFKRSRLFFLKLHIKEKIRIILMLIVEKNTNEKMKMIKLGRKDAKKNKLGKYDGSVL